MPLVQSYYLSLRGGPEDRGSRAEIGLEDANGNVVAWVRFFDSHQAVPEDTEEDGIIQMHLPSAMFPSVLNVLQNESPVGIYFISGHALLGTLPEPIGEGEGDGGGLGVEVRAAHEGPWHYDLWFGTNRIVGDLSDPPRAFGDERDPDGQVHYGSCSVEVPLTHRFGSVGTTWWKRWARFQFRDDHLRLVEVVPFDNVDAFFNELRTEMEQLRSTDRQALVYLHGYNASFEDAAIRAAQIGFDLKVPGVTAFFSWPSASDAKAYFGDQDRIEASENEIAEFLSRMALNSGANTVHILAHSMGNRGLARAIQRITARAAREGQVRFGQIILAAPDISVELFRDLAAIYPTMSEQTTMYTSAKDRALGLSGFLQDGIRAGFTPPVTVVPDIDTIEVTDIDLTMLGHGYYAQAEPVLYDMSQLLTSGLEPLRRPRLRAADSPSGAYWRIGS